MNIDYDNSSISKLIDYFKQEEISISEVVNKNKTDIEKLISQCTERIINQNNILFVIPIYQINEFDTFDGP